METNSCRAKDSDLSYSGYLTPIFFLPTFANDKIPNMTDFVSSPALSAMTAL